MDSSNILRLSNLFHFSQGGGISFVDKLNYQYTGGIMMVIISLVSARHYFGKPMQCWVPQEFTHAWEEYTEHICWVQNTYFLPDFAPVPYNDVETREQQHITYYQWVVFFLGLQAVMSYLPNLVWQIGSKRFPMLLRSAREAALPDKETRRKAVGLLTSALEERAQISNSRHHQGSSLLEKFLSAGNFAGHNSQCTTVFIISRLMCIGVSIGQICLMQNYLGYHSVMFGIDILRSVSSGKDWKQSGYFPRVTFCRVSVRRWGLRTEASYTVQCVLSLNFFLEKVYVFLWIWFISLAFITTVSSLHWIVDLCLPFRRNEFISSYLRALRQLSSCNDHRDCDKFVRQQLGLDGVLLLRAVSSSASDLVALDVTSKLWNRYKHSKSTGAQGTGGQDDQLTRFLDNIHKTPSVAVV